MLPNARLVTIEGAAHLPWIESHKNVFESIHTFLDGEWPEHAKRIDHAGAI
jgi:pimeloyl-ACP methyl ester carboxylesterase